MNFKTILISYILNFIGNGSAKEKQSLLQFAKTLNAQQSDGIPYETNLQIGAVYFVSTNVDVEDGLFNGATGVLKLFVFSDEFHKVPKRAWLKFDHPLIGMKKRELTKSYQEKNHIDLSLVAVDHVKKNISKTGRHNGLLIVRKQIPLVAASGMTINKAQGSSLPFVVVEMNKKTKYMTRERLYVACSRATFKNELFIEGDFIPPNKPKDDDPVTVEIERMKKQNTVLSLTFFQDLEDDEFHKLYFSMDGRA